MQTGEATGSIGQMPPAFQEAMRAVAAGLKRQLTFILTFAVANYAARSAAGSELPLFGTVVIISVGVGVFSLLAWLVGVHGYILHRREPVGFEMTSNALGFWTPGHHRRFETSWSDIRRVEELFGGLFITARGWTGWIANEDLSEQDRSRIAARAVHAGAHVKLRRPGTR